MQKLIFILPLMAVVVVSGCLGQNGYNSQAQPANQQPTGQQPAGTGQPQTQPGPAHQTVTVKITSQGFSPNAVSIKAGDTVTWVNEGTEPAWPASAAHPTHTVYPGSGIEKCGTAGQPNIFDACKGLNQGETFSFIFNSAGSWKYHDHLDPQHFGTINVAPQ